MPYPSWTAPPSMMGSIHGGSTYASSMFGLDMNGRSMSRSSSAMLGDRGRRNSTHSMMSMASQSMLNFGLQPPPPDMSSNPSAEEVAAAVRTYLTTQDLMKVTKAS